MADIAQLNVRVPLDAFDVVRDLSKLLRADPAFRHRLQRLFDERSDPDVSALIGQRLERLERQVADLMAAQSQMKPTGPSGAGIRAQTPSMFEAREHEPEPRSKWHIGEGRGRRLTPEGEAELDRLLDEGRRASEIADILGVRPNTVHNRRKKR